jgi:hypothetical protein
MSMKSRWPSALLFLLIPATAAAQSFNLDFGASGPGPASSYAAAGIAGVWHRLDVPHTSAGTGPQPFDIKLIDVNGTLTNVGLHQYGGTSLLLDPDASLSGDDAVLLDDGLMAYIVSLKTCLFFNGLENGTYEVLTYAWRPNHPQFNARTFFDFTVGDFLSGGAWGGQHALGITYVRHVVQVTNGFMGPHSGLPNGGDTAIGAMMNGIQLRKITCVGCTSYCFGSGSGTACPCGNAGVAGAGCANSTGGDGGRLVASGVPSLANDSVLLTAEGLPTATAILFFQGTLRENGGAGSVFGDGLMCASGTVIRLGVRFASGDAASFGFGDGSGDLVSVAGVLPAVGGIRRYQGWYRDATPGFCTAQTFNLTNGMEIPWTP